MGRGGVLARYVSVVVTCVVAAMVLSSFVTAPSILTAQAAKRASTTAATLSLQVQNGPFVYGKPPAVRFSAMLVFATKPTFTGPGPSITVQVDGNPTYSYTSANQPTVSPDGLTYTFMLDAYTPTLLAGAHSAIATYTGTSPSTTSSAVDFTVGKASPALDCSFGGVVLVSPSQSVAVSLNLSNIATPVDASTATFSFTLTGPTTVGYPHLHAVFDDAYHSHLTLNAPAQIGAYAITCTFDGTSQYDPSSFLPGTIIVSEKHPVGGAQIFTNPTTLVANQRADMYVVLNAAAGLPAPNGSFFIKLGNASTAFTRLGSDGTLLVHLDPLPYLGATNEVVIFFQGDPYYDQASFSFPLTNPPIPGNTGSAPPVSGHPGATPTAGGTARASTLSATGTSGGHTTTSPTLPPNNPRRGTDAFENTLSGGGAGLWLLIGAIVVLGGGAAGAVFWWRRTHIAPPA